MKLSKLLELELEGVLIFFCIVVDLEGVFFELIAVVATCGAALPSNKLVILLKIPFDAADAGFKTLGLLFIASARFG